MRNLLKRLIGVNKKTSERVIDPHNLRIDFERPIHFPELHKMFGGMRRSLECDLHLTSTMEISYADFPVGRTPDDQSSDVKRRTTNIIVAIPQYNLVFDVRQHEGDQSVNYSGFDFHVIPSLPLTPEHLEKIERCRAYTRYHFSKYG